MFKKNSTNAELQAYFDANREKFQKYKFSLYNVDFSIARMQEMEKFLEKNHWCYTSARSKVQYLETFYDIGGDYTEVKEDDKEYTVLCHEAMNFGRTIGTFHIDKSSGKAKLDPVFIALDPKDSSQKLYVTEKLEQEIITVENNREFAEFDGTYKEYEAILDKFILPSEAQIERSIGTINLSPYSLDEEDRQFLL